MKSLIIFNLDGLLTERKSDVDGGEMVRLPVLLLGIVDGAIISRGVPPPICALKVIALSIRPSRLSAPSRPPKKPARRARRQDKGIDAVDSRMRLGPFLSVGRAAHKSAATRRSLRSINVLVDASSCAL